MTTINTEDVVKGMEINGLHVTLQDENGNELKAFTVNVPRDAIIIKVKKKIEHGHMINVIHDSVKEGIEAGQLIAPDWVDIIVVKRGSEE